LNHHIKDKNVIHYMPYGFIIWRKVVILYTSLIGSTIKLLRIVKPLFKIFFNKFEIILGILIKEQKNSPFKSEGTEKL
jgi:hypothetical protein